MGFVLVFAVWSVAWAGDASTRSIFYQARGANQWLVRDEGLLFEAAVHSMILVADPDVHSRVAPDQYLWRTQAMRAELRPDAKGGYAFEVRAVTQLETDVNRRGRSLELSEVCRFGHLLLAFCDFTGLVWKLTSDGHCFQRWALADGDGNNAKPFKSEWATTKGEHLYVGSNGLEWLQDGQVLHYNNQWVKRISLTGEIANIHWGPIYAALRHTVNASAPSGYVLHEAFFFDAMHRIWVVLPRKSSTTVPYHPRTDDRLGTNVLFLCSEGFDRIEVRRVGPVELEWGFTSLKKVPGTNDTFAATKVREILGEKPSTRLVVFRLTGEVLADFPVSGSEKYEGLEFVRDAEHFL
jgi:soluble calcium-activated nucleotidase 1